ncbi:hypothetical protein VTK73DRAFT_3434 [Phialemonium thermophilum]|uniref:Secreted protein n=1 Tax=Phialemonium thermophilum TaxID=223376 RepID=A0ABR3VID9_9PEZI
MYRQIGIVLLFSAAPRIRLGGRILRQRAYKPRCGRLLLQSARQPTRHTQRSDSSCTHRQSSSVRKRATTLGRRGAAGRWCALKGALRHGCYSNRLEHDPPLWGE